MKFNLIDKENWKRKEYFDHYYKTIPCTYSITSNIDITNLLNMIKQENIKFYPTIIYCISNIVNKYDEFKTSIDEDGNVGIFETLNPSYTIFHKDNETFSSIWSEYNNNFNLFYENYIDDIETYGSIHKLISKDIQCPNLFNISSLPWTTFTNFNLNLDKGSAYLLPIFTIGKFFNHDNKVLLPLSLQAHHAVCDGFHVSRFINELQSFVNEFKITQKY